MAQVCAPSSLGAATLAASIDEESLGELLLPVSFAKTKVGDFDTLHVPWHRAPVDDIVETMAMNQSKAVHFEKPMQCASSVPLETNSSESAHSGRDLATGNSITTVGLEFCNTLI